MSADVMGRWETFRLRLGFAFRALRKGRYGLARRELRRPAPSAADIASVRVALVMAVASGEALAEATSAALDDMKAAGISLSTQSSGENSGLVSALSVAGSTAKTSARFAERELRRLGIR